MQLSVKQISVKQISVKQISVKQISVQRSSRFRSVRRAAAAVLLGLVLTGWRGPAEASFKNSHGDVVDQVIPLTNTSQVTVWRIEQPNTAAPASNYPQVQFQPGDQFRVLAGGCDQTGGMGRTWKLYVNPQGDNTNHLYHGLIFVPEAVPRGMPDPTPPNAGMRDFSRLSNFGVGDGLGHGNPATYTIPSPLPDHRDLAKAPITLQLGFEDDGYGDNGYYSRDPGNNDQCVNVPSAFLIITIGHHGKIPPNPELYWGITPANFDCQAGWAFDNQGTPTLSYASFQTAFQITWAGKYLNPFNEILFQAGKGIASSGNCEGMSLLAVAGEDQFTVGDLTESFWANYRYQLFSQTPENIQFDINVAQWQQLSGYFIHNWLVSIESDASTIVSNIEHDLGTGNSGGDYTYGLLSLKHGGSGHVVVPLAVTHSGGKTFIEVYNPDRPCPSIPDTVNEPKIEIDGENWSYDMGSLGVWTGSNGALGLINNGMGYVTYHGPDDGWTDQVTSPSGLLEVIFGSDVAVDQVSDSKGRKLIVDGKLDGSERGLGRVVVKLPDYAAAERPRRPRSGDPKKVLKVAREPAGTAAQQAVLAQYEREYGTDYADSRSVYVVRGTDLSDLTFTLSSKVAGKPVRAMINQGDSFIEVKSASGSGSGLIHPALTIHNAADVAGSGVTLSSVDAKGLKVSFTHGLYDEAGKMETLQQSADIAMTISAKASIASGALHLATAEAPSDVVVNKRIIAADAAVHGAEVRHETTEAIAAPPAVPPK